MAKHRWKESLQKVLVHEGGYTNDARDPGNWTGGKAGQGQLKGTKKGISAASYPNLDIKNITDTQIEFIYKRDYWDVIRADDLPGGVDYCSFDFGVNSGNHRSAQHLQRAVGAKVDGKVGPETISKAKSADPVETVRKICLSRITFLRTLSIFTTYGRGWLRRVNEVESVGVRWAAQDVGLNPDTALGGEADKANNASKNQAGGAAGSGAAGGAGGAATGAQGVDLNSLADVLVTAGIIVVFGVAVFLVARSMVNRQRAATMRAAIGGQNVT